jgi:hypothetical protein
MLSWKAMEKARPRTGWGGLVLLFIGTLDWKGREDVLKGLGFNIAPGGPADRILDVIQSIPVVVYASLGIALLLIWCIWPVASKLTIPSVKSISFWLVMRRC